jgi:hypothetical protein
MPGGTKLNVMWCDSTGKVTAWSSPSALTKHYKASQDDPVVEAHLGTPVRVGVGHPASLRYCPTYSPRR